MSESSASPATSKRYGMSAEDSKLVDIFMAAHSMEDGHTFAKSVLFGIKAVLASAASEIAPKSEALEHIQIWTPNEGKPVITLGIPGRGFWSYSPAKDDPDGGDFMLAFKEHFRIKGT